MIPLDLVLAFELSVIFVAYGALRNCHQPVVYKPRPSPLRRRAGESEPAQDTQDQAE